jgi:hypothetical protein
VRPALVDQLPGTGLYFRPLVRAWKELVEKAVTVVAVVELMTASSFRCRPSVHDLHVPQAAADRDVLEPGHALGDRADLAGGLLRLFSVAPQDDIQPATVILARQVGRQTSGEPSVQRLDHLRAPGDNAQMLEPARPYRRFLANAVIGVDHRAHGAHLRSAAGASI